MGVLIIAEAGVNHNGKPELAFQLIDAAVEAGADVVKFQTYKASNLVTKSASKAQYQTKTTGNTETQYEMLKRLELPFELHYELIDYCNKKGIRFLSTAFDQESLQFLNNDLGLSTLKIPSGEITNAPLLLEHARTGADLIVSTGMTTLCEVEDALGVIVYGLLKGKEPSRQAFKTAYASYEGQEKLKKKVTLLHCTTEYPAPIDEINLKAMLTMKQAFGLQVGYSDHTEGITVPIAAAALGATVIEKHFTIDRTMPGPDHQTSLEPDQLKQMVEAVRCIEKAQGTGVKGPTEAEIKNLPIARKSIVTKRPVRAGELFTADNLTVKRPGSGQSPMNYWDILGKKAERDYMEDEVVQ